MFSFAVRACALSGIIVAYCITTLLCRLFSGTGARFRRLVARTTSFFSRLTLRVFDVNVLITSTARSGAGTTLLIANHLSYIDILLLSSIRKTLFVASVDLAGSPFLRAMAHSGAALFVERRSHHGLRTSIDRVAEALREGISVCVFPEATSTNGATVLPFKPALLKAAAVAGVPIQPCSLAYTSVRCKPATPESLGRVCYYGDDRFFPHLLRALSTGGIMASVNFLDPVSAQAGALKETARSLHAAIAGSYAAVMKSTSVPVAIATSLTILPPSLFVQ